MAAKPNYNFEKRQRDIAKKRKQDEKLQKKRAKSAANTPEGGDTPAAPAPSDSSDKL